MPGSDMHGGDDVDVVDTRGRIRTPWSRRQSPYPPVHHRPPASPPPSSDPRGRRFGSRHRGRRVLLGVGVFVLAWLAFMVWVPFHAWGNVQRIDASPVGTRPATSKGYDYVLVGSDSRQGLTAEQQRQLSTGSAKDVLGKRTDSIILVHVPSGDGKPALISLPRDSYVPIPGHGRNKINAAYALGGPLSLIHI